MRVKHCHFSTFPLTAQSILPAPPGTTTQVTITNTDQNTLANGWSVGTDIKAAAGTSMIAKGEVTTKLAYNGMYTVQHTDAKVHEESGGWEGQSSNRCRHGQAL